MADVKISAATPTTFAVNLLFPVAISGNLNPLNVSGSSMQTAIVAAAVAAITPAQIATLDFSTLPATDPGGGRLWLNGGVLQVGP